MLTANIRIELSGLDKARKELNALLVMIDELEKDYPVAHKEEVKPKTTPRKKTETAQKPPKAPEPEQEPKKAPKTVKKTPSAVTAQDILALARETGERLGDKAKVKTTIEKYGARLNAVKVEDYEALSNDLKAL